MHECLKNGMKNHFVKKHSKHDNIKLNVLTRHFESILGKKGFFTELFDDKN